MVKTDMYISIFSDLQFFTGSFSNLNDRCLAHVSCYSVDASVCSGHYCYSSTRFCNGLIQARIRFGGEIISVEEPASKYVAAAITDAPIIGERKRAAQKKLF